MSKEMNYKNAVKHSGNKKIKNSLIELSKAQLKSKELRELTAQVARSCTLSEKN